MHWPMVNNDTCDTQGLLFSLDYCYTESHGKTETTIYRHTYLIG